MQVGDIVFFKGQSWISKVIGVLTGSPYTHVALCISTYSILEANRFIAVRSRAIKDDEIYCVMRYRAITQKQKSLILSGVALYLGEKYDYVQVLLWLIRLVFNVGGDGLINNANRVYCSELIDRLYMGAGIDLVPDRQTGDILPVHLLNSSLLTRVNITKDSE